MMSTSSHATTGRTRSNRRRHKRASLQRKVQYVHGSRVYQHTLDDISEGGLCMEGETPLANRRRVKLFVPVPKIGSKDLLCMIWGEVVWATDGRIGVRFVDPPLEHVLQVRGYVQLAA